MDFDIEREVNQGDAIFFNARLRHGTRTWKAKPARHGVQFGHGDRLTNSRYADDLYNVVCHHFARFQMYVRDLGSETFSLRLSTVNEKEKLDDLSYRHLCVCGHI